MDLHHGRNQTPFPFLQGYRFLADIGYCTHHRKYNYLHVHPYSLTKNKELQNAILKFCQSRLSVATIDQIGAAALYSVEPSFFAEAKEEYRRRRDLVVDRLKQIPGVMVQEPMGAFYLMASLPVDDADKFQHWLLQEFEDNGETVMFAPGAPFYEHPGKGVNEVRIAYVRSCAELERAMELLAKGISRYRKEQM